MRLHLDQGTRQADQSTKDLVALAVAERPLPCRCSGRQGEAEWFAEIMAQIRIYRWRTPSADSLRAGKPARKDGEPALKPDGKLYENTTADSGLAEPRKPLRHRYRPT